MSYATMKPLQWYQGKFSSEIVNNPPFLESVDINVDELLVYPNESTEMFMISTVTVFSPIILFVIAVMFSCCGYLIILNIKSWYQRQKRKLYFLIFKCLILIFIFYVFRKKDINEKIKRNECTT